MNQRKRSTPVKEEIAVFSYAPIVYFWPVITSGVILSLLTTIHPMPVTYGVIWWITLIIPISTMGIDVSRDNFVKLFLMTAVMALVGGVMVSNGISLMPLWNFISSHTPAFNQGTALWTSIIGGLLLLFAITVSRFDSRWVINSNQFQHTRWMAVDKTIAHGTITVVVEYNDMQEYVLLFAGDIVFYRSGGSQEVARITNVPFLPWKWPEIRELVEEVRTRALQPPLVDDEPEDDDAI
jgi:hypothetical protein